MTDIDRTTILPGLFPHPRRFVFVSGLAGSSRDAAALTGDGDNLFALGGAMGAASMIGLGVALASAESVVVITGDGELLMNLGSLVTIAQANPRNLSIVCLDNGRHGETGNQHGHTSRGADLEAIARGAGFKRTMTIASAAQTKAACEFLTRATGPAFLVVKVMETAPSQFKRLMDPAACRMRFKMRLAAPAASPVSPSATAANR